MTKCSSLWLVAVAMLCLTASTAAQTTPELQELVFPIVSLGPAGDDLHFQTTLSFINLSDSTVEGSLVILDSQGANVTDSIFGACRIIIIGLPPVLEWPVVVAPGETVRTILPLTRPLLEGWATLHWEGVPSVTASAELTLIKLPVDPSDPCEPPPVENRPSGEIADSTVLPAVEWMTEARFPVVGGHFRETAISIVQLESIILAPVAPTVVQILDEDGAVIREFRLSVGTTRTGLFLSEIFKLNLFGPEQEPLPEEFRGWVRITSGLPFAVSAVDLLFPDLRFVNVPVIANGAF